MSRKDFDAELREIIQEDNALIELSDGQVWKTKNRKVLWDRLGSRLFDDDIARAGKVAVRVLTERNPQFDFSPEKRFYASFDGKTFSHSSEIRKNLAETLALLGNRYHALTHCSPGKPQYVASMAVREIFADADWRLWGSLNRLLPTLAEAAPNEFIRAVESALANPVCPFDELFRQEGSGPLDGENYLTGLLWGLEALAWDETLLARVCVVLAELAEHDPGGSWANRPGNSISSTLLPWYPQTFAPLDKRIAAMRAVFKDSPNVAWDVLLAMLPDGMRSTTGNYKSEWLAPVSEDWKPSVTGAEHFEQIETYALMAVELASTSVDRQREFIRHLGSIPRKPFEAFLDFLASDQVGSLGDDEKSELWKELTAVVSRHRQFADANWAMPDEPLGRIEAVAEVLQPTDPRLLHRRLFEANDSDLYDAGDSYEEEQKKLSNRRIKAVREIIDLGGLESVLDFAKTVQSPAKVGFAAARIDDCDLDEEVLPEQLLSSNDAVFAFASNYAFWRFLDCREPWLDGIDRSNWSTAENCELLKSISFDEPVWNRLSDWLGEAAAKYWREVIPNPYQTEGPLRVAVENLLAVGRPHAAIDCLYCQHHRDETLDSELAVRALISALSSTESVGRLSQHHVVDLIKALQSDLSVPESEMVSIEWGYLRLLQHDGGAAPSLLKSKLATDPEFFCETIRAIYKSQNENQPGNADDDVDELKERIAANAWHLLHDWNTPPGSVSDGPFDAAMFAKWLERVKQICEETGHIEVAMIKVGEVLYFVPEDSDGFWIDRTVAEFLNDRKHEGIRSGFRTQIFNSRGVHWVDPTGSPEIELAKDWHAKADAAELEGYARFAGTLRQVAESYEQDADRIVREHRDRTR